MQKEIIEGFRLSPQQRRLWSLQQGQQVTPYHAQCAIHVEGMRDTARLHDALRNVCRQFEILRTAFLCPLGMNLPVQVIVDDAVPSVFEEDLTGLSSREQSERIETLLRESRLAAREYDLPPLWQASILALSPTSHELLLTLPALCADGASLTALVSEIAREYAADPQGTERAEEPLQYADVAEWQNELFKSDESSAGRRYWSERYLSPLPVAQLPFANQELGDRRLVPDSLSLTVDAASSARMRKLVESDGAMLSDLLLSCWQVLLWRLTGQSELVTGVFYDGRNHEELLDVLGPLARYLPVRAVLHESMSFRELLGQTRKTTESAGNQQGYFSWEQADESGRDLIGTPFFPFCFEFGEWPEEFTAGNASFSMRQWYACDDAFKIKLSCVSLEEALRLDFHFDSGSYAAPDIEQMVTQFRTVLESVLDNPEARITELDILGAAERMRLLEEFSMTKSVSLPPDSCVQHLFESWANQTPDAVALVSEGHQLTYAALNARANQLGHYLRRNGVGAETLVGLLVERSAEMIVGMLGVLKAGGAYVPLDPALPGERLALMLAEAKPLVLLTQQHLTEKVSGATARVVRLDSDWASEVAPERRTNPRGGVRQGNAAYVLFTSGSTGVPKGVVVEHRQLLNYLFGVQERLALPPGTTFALVSTLAADLGNTSIFPSLCGGGSLHVISRERAVEPAALAEYFTANQIDCLKIVPSHLEALQSVPCPDEVMPLRRLVLGGESSRWYWVRRLQALAPECTIINHYGPTETTVGVLTYEVGEAGPKRHAANVPLGRPINNVRIYVIDAALRPSPIWVPAELHVGGASVARGYHDRPAATAEKFIPDPFSDVPGARLYKTGDLARFLPDADVEFIGRIDYQVKIRGFRVELGEIEAVMTGSVWVREGLVVLGESAAGDQRLIAYVVPRTPEGEAARHDAGARKVYAAAFPVDELRRYLQERLPDYMVPSAFVLLEQMPLTLNGKVDRRALPAPESVAAAPKQDSIAPRNDVERQLVQVWEEVLGVRPIGVRDNFFELGGYSLLALRLLTRVNQQFGRELSLQLLLQTETVESMAELIRQPANGSAPSPLVALQPQGSRTPFFCMHPVTGSAFVYVALARLVGLDQPFYGLQASVAKPLTKIEDMATHYLEAVRAIQPEGPYLLGGWSMGGLIALEMAAQLLAQGQEVALLVLIDRAAFDAEPQARDEAVLQAWFAQTIESVKEQAAKTAGELSDFGPSMYHRLFNVYKINHRAVEQYVPRPYAGRITLFRAAESPIATPDQTLGWGELAGAVDIQLIPGNHTSMLLEPGVRTLAERLGVCIESATSVSGVEPPALHRGERAPSPP